MATTTEVNPNVNTAATSPGTMSALGNPVGTLSATPDLSSLVTDPSTLQATPGWNDFLSSIDSSGTTTSQSPVSAGTGSTDFLSGLSGAFDTTPSSASPAGGTGTTGSSISSWLSNLMTGTPGSGGLAGLGPYAAVGAAGIAQAKATQNQNQDYVKQLAALGGPQTTAGQQLLKQFQSGQLTPQEQRVVDTSQKQGADLMNAAAPLSAIAQQAYQNYQSGVLPAADEQRLKDQVTQQQQQIRQQLASQGITDSSILAGYDQQIQNQADITRQQLLDARFATGNQAYDRWLTTTQQGQQLQLQGQQYAVTSLDTMLNQSLGLTAQGMTPVAQSIQLAIQSDTELSQQINDLIGNLSAAYSYQASGGGRAAGGAAGSVGGAPGASSNLLSTIMSGVKGVNTATNLLGAGGATTGAAGAADAAGIAGGWAADAASTDAALAGLSADTGLATSTTAADIAAANDAWLAGGGFSAAGGEAAGAGAAEGAASEAAGAAAAGDTAGAGAGSAAASGALGATAAIGMGALGIGGTLYEFAHMNDTMTPQEQYADLANTSAQAQQQNQALQQAIASGKAVPGPNGTYTINGVDASVYYPLAGKSSTDLQALNTPLAQNFLFDKGYDWTPDKGGVTGVGPGRGVGNQSVSRS